METPFLPFAAYYWYLVLQYIIMTGLVLWFIGKDYIAKSPVFDTRKYWCTCILLRFLLKSGPPKFAIFFLGSAQMSNLRDNLWKIIKIIFFRKWLSTGSLDTHLAQSLILPSLVQTSIHFLTVKELCIIVCQLDVCITWCVFLFFPDRKLRKV